MSPPAPARAPSLSPSPPSPLPPPPSRLWTSPLSHTLVVLCLFSFFTSPLIFAAPSKPASASKPTSVPTATDSTTAAAATPIPTPTPTRSASRTPSPRLGNGGASAKATADLTDTLFRGMDYDGDGRIEADEIRSFLKTRVGGDAFDTPAELDSGTLDVFENVLSPTTASSQPATHSTAPINPTTSSSFSPADLARYWSTLGNLLTVGEVYEWIGYGMELPQLARSFFNHSVTGYDLPVLIENDGQVMQEELGITSKLHRAQITRAIHMRLLGIGDAPHVPTDVTASHITCSSVTISWQPSPPSLIPVHHYRIQRRQHPHSWHTIAFIADTSYTDTNLIPHTSYRYRIQSWSHIGHSEFSKDVEIITHDISDTCQPSTISKPKVTFPDAELVTEHTSFVHTHDDMLVSRKHGTTTWMISLTLLSGLALIWILRQRTPQSNTSQQQSALTPTPSTSDTTTPNGKMSINTSDSAPPLKRPTTSTPDNNIRSTSPSLNAMRPPIPPQRTTRPILHITPARDGIPKGDAQTPPQHPLNNRQLTRLQDRPEQVRAASRSSPDLLALNNGQTVPPLPSAIATSSTTIAPPPITRPRSASRPDVMMNHVDTLLAAAAPEVVGNTIVHSLSANTLGGAGSPTAVDLCHCCVCHAKLGWKSLVDSSSSSSSNPNSNSNSNSNCNSHSTTNSTKSSGWRFKHTCHICHRSFCHQHGYTPHMRFTACSVPGSCTCNICLDMLQKSMRR